MSKPISILYSHISLVGSSICFLGVSSITPSSDFLHPCQFLQFYIYKVDTTVQWLPYIGMVMVSYDVLSCRHRGGVAVEYLRHGNSVLKYLVDVQSLFLYDLVAIIGP